MARIEFNLDYYLAHLGCKVETREGIPMDFVMRDDATTQLVFRNMKDKDLMVYREDGRWYDFPDEDCTDLFIVTDDPELTEFENRIAEVLNLAINHTPKKSDEEIVSDTKSLSPKLLSLARKQLIQDGYICEKKEYLKPIKQEWNEEDEKMLQAIILDYKGEIEHLTDKDIDMLVKPVYKKRIDWLKSLRPQPHCKNTGWSKEDNERYISCLQRLGTGNSDQPETVNSLWFKEHIKRPPITL